VSVSAIILAAGASRRMGQPKQLMEVEGEAFVRRAARVALEAICDPVIVVLGYRAEEVGASLTGLPVATVINTAWDEGMASSIRAGINAVPQGATAALLLACDQPAVDTAFLAAMMHAHHGEQDRIIAAAYEGAVGIPALFPRRCFESLEGLTGDRGARALLEAAEVLSLPLPGGGMDVDTTVDYEEMRRRLEPS